MNNYTATISLEVSIDVPAENISELYSIIESKMLCNDSVKGYRIKDVKKN